MLCSVCIASFAAFGWGTAAKPRGERVALKVVADQTADIELIVPNGISRCGLAARKDDSGPSVESPAG